MEEEAQTAAELSPLNAIRVETALSRYPVHRLARKGEIRIQVQEGGRDAALSWEVTPNSKYGQPGPLAYKLDTLIINRRIEEAHRPIPRLIKLGSLHDICKELGISEGKNKSAIKQALFQNASTFITANIRFRTADGSERTLEAGFTRYNVIFTGEKLPDGRKADGVYVALNDNFIAVINGAMTRPLDYDYLKSLPPAPQRFYELLSYQMYAALKHDRPRAKLTYSDFCDHAPQTRYFDWVKVRNQMSKLHRPHRLSGYIAKVDFQQTTDRIGKPDWIMLYQPGPKARAEFRAFTKRGGPVTLEVEPSIPDPLPLLAASEPSPIEAELIARGVSGAEAAKMASEQDEATIRLQIEHLDWQIGKKPGKIDNPAAWLVSAIRTNASLPKGFVPAAERQRRAESKRNGEELEAAKRRLQQQQDAEAKAERQRIESYWASLTPEQQAEIDSASTAQADPKDLALERGPMKSFGQQIRRHAYIRQVLGIASEKTEPA